MPPSRRASAVYDPDYKFLIARVREARQEAGMTQSDVARALDRPLSFVSKCKLGERRIDPIDLEKFAELYNKPFQYFFPSRRRKTGKTGKHQ